MARLSPPRPRLAATWEGSPDGGEDGFAYRAEAIILPDGENRTAGPGEAISLEGKREIVVQTNLGLGMYVTGQALVTGSRWRKYHRPASLEPVALVPGDDLVVRSFVDGHPFLRRWVEP